MGMVGENALRRGFGPSTFLTKNFQKVDGKIVKDRLIKQATKDGVMPTAEGGNKAAALLREAQDKAAPLVKAQTAAGHVITIDEIAAPEMVRQTRLRGGPLTPKERKRVMRGVVAEIDDLLRSSSHGNLRAIIKQPGSKIIQPGQTSPVKPKMLVKQKWTPDEVQVLKQVADEAAIAEHGRVANTAARSASNPALAKRIADGSRKALKMGPGGKELHKANILIQSRLGVARMAENAAASNMPVNMRLPLVTVPIPRGFAGASGHALQNPALRATGGASPTLADIILSAMGNYSPSDTTGGR